MCSLLVAIDVSRSISQRGILENELDDNFLDFFNRLLDHDASGKKQSKELHKLLPNSLCWATPEVFGKDPGEAWKRMDLSQWIEEGISIGSDPFMMRRSREMLHRDNPLRGA